VTKVKEITGGSASVGLLLATAVGMPPFQEIVNHAKKKNLTLHHQNQQIQNFIVQHAVISVCIFEMK